MMGDYITATSASSGTSRGSTSGSGGSSSGRIVIPPDKWPGMYMQAHIYPTRQKDSTHFLFSWNDYAVDYDEIVSVRLYLTTTPYDEIKANDSWSVGDENPFSDSMANVINYNITSQAKSGELYETWLPSGYTVVAAIQFRATVIIPWYEVSDGDATTVYTNYPVQVGLITHTRIIRQTSSNLITDQYPSVTLENKHLKIGLACQGKRVIEFHRTDVPYGGDSGITDEETLNETLYTTMLNQEFDNPYLGYFYFGNYAATKRWGKGSHTVGVSFQSSENQALISSAIDSAIGQINSVMNEFGISFRRSGDSGDITITVDTEQNLYGIDLATSSYVYGGTWSVSSGNGVITSAEVKIACDFQSGGAYFEKYETVVFEELLQSMGAGFDQVEYPHNTIHTDFNYWNKKSTMYEKDANILRLLYSDQIGDGASCLEVCKTFNIPKGVYIPSEDQSDAVLSVPINSFLDAGCSYEVRAFVVDSNGMVSATSPWVTIETPAFWGWDWDVSNGPEYNASAYQTSLAHIAVTSRGCVGNFSYLVWNDLCAKVLEVRTVAGSPWDEKYAKYDETRMTSEDRKLTAKRFNSLRYNTYTEWDAVNPGDVVYGSYFTGIADQINIWIDWL